MKILPYYIKGEKQMSRKEKRKQKTFFNYFIIGATFGIMFILGIEEYKDNKIKKQEESKLLDYSVQDINYEEQKRIKEYPKAEVEKEYKGYEVSSKLEIPKIELETYILSNYSEKALNVSATKFWGADANIVRKFLRCRA